MLKTNSCLRLVKSEAMFQNVYTIFIKRLNTPDIFHGMECGILT